MAPTKITHAKVLAAPEEADNPDEVQRKDWDADHVLALSVALAAFDLLSPSAGKLPYFDTPTSLALATLSDFARDNVLNAANVSALRGLLASLNKAGDTMTGPLVLSGDATAALNPVTKQQFDNALAGLRPKAPVIAAAPGNIDIASAPASCDGRAGVVGDRWLLPNQTGTAQNGIYVFSAAGAPLTRAADFNDWSEIPGSLVLVESGDTLHDTGWFCNADPAGTLDTTAIACSRFYGSGLFQPSSAILTTLAGLASVANLSAEAGLTGAADKVSYFTGLGAKALATFTSFGRSIVACVDAAAAFVVLGLGTAATKDVGTGANKVVQFDGSGKYPAGDGSQITGIGNSGRVLLATLTASNSASLADTTHLTSAYDRYEFDLQHVVLATDDTRLCARFSEDAGSTWKATGYLAGLSVAPAITSGSAPAYADPQTTFIALSSVNAASYGMSNASGRGWSGTLTLRKPSGTTNTKTLEGSGSYPTVSSNKPIRASVTGYYDADQAAVNGVQFFGQSSNIAIGVIRVYGIRTS
ncbi:MAG: hypothetical protein GC182_08480 [Rhodopseudomonas sp.]|nr:hypothetical protein [Rhodopseudomonas sp.]